ncbi:glycosyltransferase [Celerinatantimonas diazotrophica]|uniref:glycosyltransferase n=1 Tax=Celerinatantimonas diazotrophica TaxID=412034 RepID=UPI0010441C7C|nr:glycosyltransferase [Celerinatantimonas diazotrophica]
MCAVIVTYSNRFGLLKQVIKSCIENEISTIIVVDNNSTSESKEQLVLFEQKYSKVLQVIYLDKNFGSAGGYKIGLQRALEQKCDYIYLLDDDNKLKHNAVSKLVDEWTKLVDIDNKEEQLALLSYRSDRTIYKEAIIKNNPSYILGMKNSFLGFHILDIPFKIIKFIKKKFIKVAYRKDCGINSGKVLVAPYGGMFFHKQLIKKIGLPNELFFVYADDYEWSYRIPNIYLVLDSQIEDIDISWNLKKISSPFYTYLNNGSDFRVYYSVRNRVYFEQSIVNNRYSYSINKAVFLFFLFFYRNCSNKSRYEIFKKAVIDGLSGNLGETFDMGI